MREILFRGKRIDNGNWETGSLVFLRKGTSEEKAFIADKTTAYHTPVVSDSIGQYTGLKDAHGTRIFEGDVVKDITPLYKGLTPRGREEMLKERAKKRGIAVVKFGYHDVKADDPFCIGRAYGVYFEGDMELTTPAQYYGYGDWQESEDYQFEVIGNIWDNPELLEGEK